jgi:zinc transport system permease protein
MIEILGYGFMQNALLTGAFIAIACSLLGVFLVLKRYALIGDGMAHIAFGGIALGLLFGVMPFFAALAFALIAALGILRIREKAHLHGDAAIGIVSQASLGIGIFVISVARGYNVDIMSYLFGSILSITKAEMGVAIALTAIVTGVIIYYYRDLFALTFDEESARASGIRVTYLNTLLVMLTAATVVLSMKVAGLMLASALIVLPAAAALQVANSFRRALVYSGIIAVFSVTAGIMLSYLLDAAASGTIVLVEVTLFIILALVRRLRR